MNAGAFAYGYIGTEGEENWYRLLTTAWLAIMRFRPMGTLIHTCISIIVTRPQSLLKIMMVQDPDKIRRLYESLSADTWYYVKIRGFENSVTGSYSIGVNALPAPPSANNVLVTYDGLVHSAGATVPTDISIVWYDAATGGNITVAPSGTNVGTYVAWAESVNSTGYKSASRTEVTLTIDKAPLTIKANNASKYCGQVNPDFSVT